MFEGRPPSPLFRIRSSNHDGAEDPFAFLIPQKQETKRQSTPVPRINTSPLHPSSDATVNFSPSNIKTTDTNDSFSDACSKESRVSITHSVSICEMTDSSYSEWFMDQGENTVELIYTAKYHRETFSLLRPKNIGSECVYDSVNDLISTMKILVQHTALELPEIRYNAFWHENSGVFRRLERARNKRIRREFIACVHEFNVLFSRCKKEGYVLGYTKRRMATADENERKKITRAIQEFASFDLVSHVLFQSYARTVSPYIDVLLNYPAFSSTAYGEINPSFVEQIISHLNIKLGMFFMDLGSGTGNVVLHVAARTECRAYGIEIQSGVAKIAMAQLEEFKSRFRYFNKRLGQIRLDEGDMRTHPAVPEFLKTADVVLVNNYVFQPELNRALLELFLDMKEGARVVTLRELAPPDMRLTNRNCSSPEAVWDISVQEYGTKDVSWTEQGGKWFIHTMNRQRLKGFE